MAAPSPVTAGQRDRAERPCPASREETLHRALALLRQPGLILVAGPPGAGRTRLLDQASEAQVRPVHRGGGLAMLTHLNALALERATRARMPADDLPLLAEAVWSRTRGGVLVIDDLQWCDAATLAVLPVLAERLPVLAALRTPHRLPAAAFDRIAQAAVRLDLAPLGDTEADAVVADANPALAPAQRARVLARAGGNPLALTVLARAASQPDPAAAAPSDPAAAAAAAVADLPRPGRTALAALGLLGRPAHPNLLGDGADLLVDAGLATADGDHLRPTSPWLAEIAAGILDRASRTALHAHLARATCGVEAARHLEAAGDTASAVAAAVAAADAATGPSDAAEALLLAARLDPAHRLRAARAAISAGRPRAALALLADTSGADASTLRSWAHLTLGDTPAARACLDTAGDTPEADRLRLLTCPPADRPALAAAIRDRHGDTDHPGLAAALAGTDPDALHAAEQAARAAGDTVIAHWCAWLRVTALADRALLAAAETAARTAARDALDAGAYSWQTRFLAAASWCRALTGTDLDALISAGTALADRALPAVADALTAAAVALAEADTGALGAARTRLHTIADPPAALRALIDWLDDETAWLDGRPGAGDPAAGTGLVGALAHITGRWIAYDTGTDPVDADGAWPAPAAATLHAWDAADADAFTTAAAAWNGLAAREQVRALLAAAAHARGPAAVAALEQAETIAETHGLTVLAGRARRGLRRHDVRRDRRSQRGTGGLTERETEVLTHVAAGHPSRRIAEILGITAETVETHIRSGMRKLGAKTRTEAAVLLGTIHGTAT